MSRNSGRFSKMNAARFSRKWGISWYILLAGNVGFTFYSSLMKTSSFRTNSRPFPEKSLLLPETSLPFPEKSYSPKTKPPFPRSKSYSS